MAAAVLLLAAGSIAADTDETAFVFPAGMLEEIESIQIPEYSGSVRDARVMALGGAFTALADDANALYYNPAGLAYLRNTDLRFGGTTFADLRSGVTDDASLRKALEAAIDATDTYTVIYKESDPEEISYIKDNRTDAPLDEEEKDLLIMSAGGLILLDEGFDQVRVIPNITFADRGFGIGLISSMEVNPQETLSSHTELSFTHKRGIIGGFSFNAGPAALGVNGRYYKQDSHLFTFDYDPTDDLNDADEEFKEVVMNPLEGESIFEAGGGGMLTLGPLTAGIYVDNLLNLALTEEGSLTDDYDGLLSDAWETANAGLAFEPFSRKDSYRNSFINLIAVGDLKNIGDDEARAASVGAEAGLNIGDVLTADLRAGYSQYLPGELSEISRDSFDAARGEVTFGAGVKALILNLDIAASVPAVMIKHGMEFDKNGNGPADDDEMLDYLSAYGANFPKVMISGGLSF